MPLQGEYDPSPSDWVREQVDKYERSGGTEATELRGVPVVVITSYPDDTVRHEVERLGAVLLPKPFTRATLQRAVAGIARRRGQPT